MKVELISATRKSQEEFQSSTALGLSLRRLAGDENLIARIAAANTRGLGTVYNEMLAGVADDSIVAFVHDDVWIDDYFLSERVAEGVQAFDVIGVAGSRGRMPRQPGWCVASEAQSAPEVEKNMSGRLAHGRQPFGVVSKYGPVPASCELLDGVLLAAKKSVLTRSAVAFDPRFRFHFYDLDFCRTARKNGLTLGTWPICLTHESVGAFDSAAWGAAYQTYLQKWGD
jgi:hypothetical protein